MKKYNNKYMTDKEIIDLMKLEVEYYKKELEKLKQIKKDNKIESVTTAYYTDGQLTREQTVYYK